LRRTLLL